MSYKYLKVRSLHFVYCFVCFTLLPSGDLLSDQIFTDNFDSTSYNSFELNSSTVPPPAGNVDDISFSNFGIQVAGGNPGGFGQIDHEHDVERGMDGLPLNGDGMTFVQSFHVNQNFSHDPQADGIISEIEFSLDYLTTSFSVDSVFFIVSDSNGGSAAAFSIPVASGNWETVNSGSTFQTDFSGRDFSGSLALQFGFGFTTNDDVFFDPTGHTINVDNFVVDITTIPEPSSAALVLTGLIVGIAARRKR